ncbi:MAG: PDZ domain-containing protein [Magnetococcales bacterium]|nr:PDZ domain-containing protein [Magnetococcales bacterium]
MRLGGPEILSVGILGVLGLLVFNLFDSPDYEALPVKESAGVQGGAGVPQGGQALGQTVAMVQPVQAPNGGNNLIARRDLRGSASGLRAQMPGKDTVVRAPVPIVVPGGNAGSGRPARSASRGSFIVPGIQISEAHWQGLEALPLDSEIKEKMKLPESLQGLMVDEVSLAAGGSGILAGDVLIAIDGRPVNSLKGMLQETIRVRNRQQVSMTVYRDGEIKGYMLSVRGGLTPDLGMAQVETAPMILAGDIVPHPYRGPCTNCHPIGTTGHIVPDPDGIVLPPPVIKVGARSPHQDRGPCEACHTITK